MDALIIATYNEAQNAPALVRELRGVLPELTIIVVDDNSPDGTAQRLRELGDQRLTVLVRTRERGYGTAVRDGLRHAVRIGAQRVATMDADFSHEPKILPALFDALSENDIAIGSRYAQGVRVLNWQIRRLLLSLFANWYVRVILGLPAMDCTSGYRAYRAELLRKMKLKTIKSNGYSFLVEMMWRAKRCNASVGEVPIVFMERREGESKMSRQIIFESIFLPWKLRLFGR